MQTLLQDLRYGFRMLRKGPGVTAAAVASLALGIGVNTAIFSLIDAVLLKTLPVADPKQLYFINNVGTRGGGGSPPYPCFEQFRINTRYLSGLAAFSPVEPKLNIDGQLEQIRGQFASGNYFSVLGVKTILGRPLSPSDDSVIGKGGPDGPVAVISHNYWKRRFGKSPSVIGKVVQIDNHSVTIIGVTPAEFYGLMPGTEVNITLPMMLSDPRLFTAHSWWFDAVGRLKPGVSMEQARSELDAIFQRFMGEASSVREMRKDYFDHIELAPASKGLATLRRQFSEPLLILMSVVGLVLLIACANVANLLLARGTARRREFGIRLALGASRARLIRLMVTESLLLVSFGGLFGLALADWSSALLVNFFATGRGRIFLNLDLDFRLLLFTAGTSVLSAVIFGSVPAFLATRVDPIPALKESAGTVTSGRSRLLTGKLLVIVQVSVSLLLLVGAGLFSRSLRNLKNLDAGFQPEGVLTMRVDSGAMNYQGARLTNFWNELLGRVAVLPGVRIAALSTLSPMSGRDRGVMIEIPGFAARAARDMAITLNHVSADYFTTMGIAVRQGRSFTQRDNESAQKVALLNETAARFYFGDKSPIGAVIRFSRPYKVQPYEIVGVVRDSKHNNLREEAPRLLYLPLLQPIDRLGNLTLAIRTGTRPTDLVDVIRNEIRTAGRDTLVTDVATLAEQVNQSLIQERLVSILSGFFGLLALLLACVGLYGLMSYAVARRTHEIGIRVAVGAQRGDVVWMVLRESMLLIIVGLVFGLLASFAATRLISSQLFGISPHDSLTIVGATLILAAVALIAGYLPARRAAKVDPIVALRYE